MIRRPPRSTLDRSSAASDVYKRQAVFGGLADAVVDVLDRLAEVLVVADAVAALRVAGGLAVGVVHLDAVSYTHLRAHVTVLGLVCRLLLEKKN